MSHHLLVSLFLISLPALAFAQKLPAKQPWAPFQTHTPFPGYNVFGKQLTPQELQALRTKQVAEQKETMKRVLRDCNSYTKEKDIEGRAIVPQVLTGMGDTCHLETYKPIQNLESFMGDIKKTMRTFDATKVWDEATQVALDKSVRAVLSLHHRFVKMSGPMSEAQATDLICKKLKGFCSDKRAADENAVIQKSIRQFMMDNKKKPIKYLDGAEQEKLKTQFNEYVANANATCKLISQKKSEIYLNFSCGPKIDFACIPPFDKEKAKTWVKPANCGAKPKFEQMTMGKCDGIMDQRRWRMNQLVPKATESLMLHQQFVMSSELAPLLVSDKFRKHVGMENPAKVFETCTERGGNFLNPIWHKQINEGRSQMYDLATQELQTVVAKRQVPSNWVNEEKEIKKYLKTNPQTISELLNRHPDPNYARAVCSFVKDIHWDDKIDHIIDGVIIGVGVVAGLAFTIATGGAGLAVTGPLASTLAAISIGTTVIGITKNQLDANALMAENQSIKQAMATQQKNLDDGIREVQTNEFKFDALITARNWGVGGLVLEVVGLGFARHAALAKVTTLKKTPMLYKMVDGATDVAKSEKLAIGSNNFVKAVKKLGEGKAGFLKDLSSDEQVKMAALFSKLDEAKGTALAQKLSKLPQDELKKFYLMMDDLGKVETDAAKVMAKVDDFMKTGKPTRVIGSVQPKEWKAFSPAITNDAKQVAKVYPKSWAELKRIYPKASAEQLRTILQDVRANFAGKITDDEVAIFASRFTQQGAKNSDQLLKRFTHLTALKTKHADLFAKEGVLGKNFKDESELTKLVYLDDIERNGVPLRNASGELILSADGSSVLRKQLTKLSPAQRMKAIKEEFQFVSQAGPCSL